jgi:hypothetical protein
VQNVPVLRALRRPVPLIAAVTTAAALALGGCSFEGAAKDAGSSSSDASSSASPSPSSTVPVPEGTELTEQGSKLSFGDTATVIFEPAEGRGTVLRLTVKSVKQGSLDDFKGFILDDSYKQKASYYYATVTVKNVGEGDVGGVGVPLWGVNSANTLLPAVNFTTGFKPCSSKPLPKSFPKDATLSTCLVYLSPDKGRLEAVSYRPSQEFNPITWTGDITTLKPTPKKKTQKR